MTGFATLNAAGFCAGPGSRPRGGGNRLPIACGAAHRKLARSASTIEAMKEDTAWTRRSGLTVS